MGAIRFVLPALLAITGLVNAQSFGDLSSCGQNCINNMRESTPCVPVTDQCLCENASFQSGIRDCATQACAAPDAGAAIDYANSFCVSATAASSTAAATTSEAATTTAAPTTTAAAETTTTPASSADTTPASSADTTSSETSSIAVESSATSAASTEATSFSTSTTASAATETSSSETASGTSTKTSASSSSSASSTGGTPAPPSVGGLSVAGKAGVAVGAGAVGVALLALAIAMCRSKRARRPLPRGNMQISEPLPGSGRIDYDGTAPAQNPTRPQNMAPGSKLSTAFDMAELDHARPYEEMVPRVTPRRMV